VFAVLFSVGVALIRGGKIDRLVSLPFRHVWLVFLAFGIQFSLRLPSLAGLQTLQLVAPYLYPVVYFILLFCFCLNFRVPGVRVLAAGSLCNLVAILANGGKMPVSGESLTALGHSALRDAFAAGESLTHTIITPGTRLPWLADVLVGSPPFPSPTIFSIGDLLLALGVFVLVQRCMVGRHPAASSREAAKGQVE